jgi:hypothetical protein
MALKSIGWEDMDCSYLAEDKDKWKAVVNVVMNVLVNVVMNFRVA